MTYVIKKVKWKMLLKNGATAFYLSVLSNELFTLISVILELHCPFSWQQFMLFNLIMMIINIFVNLIIIICTFAFSSSLWLRFKKTLKKYSFLVVGISIIGYLLILSLSWSARSIRLINCQLLSANQLNIQLATKTVYEKIIMGLLIIIIAPFIEELAFRHAIFSLTGSKLLGFFTSVIYFAGMHVASAGDWENILEYMIGSIIITLTFLYVRGNVTYTIFLHMLSNTVTFIYILVMGKQCL